MGNENSLSDTPTESAEQRIDLGDSIDVLHPSEFLVEMLREYGVKTVGELLEFEYPRQAFAKGRRHAVEGLKSYARRRLSGARVVAGAGRLREPLSARLERRGIDLDAPWDGILTNGSVRLRNGLRRSKLVTLRQIVKSIDRDGGRRLLALPMFGTKTLDELQAALETLAARPQPRTTAAGTRAAVAAAPPRIDAPPPVVPSPPVSMEKPKPSTNDRAKAADAPESALENYWLWALEESQPDLHASLVEMGVRLDRDYTRRRRMLPDDLRAQLDRIRYEKLAITVDGSDPFAVARIVPASTAEMSVSALDVSDDLVGVLLDQGLEAVFDLWAWDLEAASFWPGFERKHARELADALRTASLGAFVEPPKSIPEPDRAPTPAPDLVLNLPVSRYAPAVFVASILEQHGVSTLRDLASFDPAQTISLSLGVRAVQRFKERVRAQVRLEMGVDYDA